MRTLTLQTLQEQRNELAQCAGKVRFDSYAAAAIARQRESKRGARHGRVYRCASCNRWHIGHPSARVTYRKRASAASP